MTIRLILAPAAGGKTAYLLGRVRDAARGLAVTPRVVVPTHLQVRAWRRRLAHAGGAIGVRILTFDRLYAECLHAAGEVYTELSEPVQYRLLRSLVDALELTHYAPLVGRPGFVQILEQLIAELKAARVDPEAFTGAVEAVGGEPRLAELARVYHAYQASLQAQAWADRAGLGWLAVEALEQRACDVARDWPLLAIDGFDNFTQVQLDLMRVLAARVGETVVTLTGTVGGPLRPLAHRRFEATRCDLEAALGVEASALPEQVTRHAAPLRHLEGGLFQGNAGQVAAAGTVELTRAPDRVGEVRAALRWLKARLVKDGMAPGEVALLLRDVAPYRPFVLQTAREFGLPLRLVDGLPLRANPAIVALLDLLRLALPAREGGGGEGPALPRRLVVDAWRSPYFDWGALPHDGAAEAIGIAPGDADLLDAVARSGRVIGGRAQWDEVLDGLAARPGGGASGDMPDAAREDGRALRDKFRRFVERVTPPDEGCHRDFVCWLEALIGLDPQLGSERHPAEEDPTSLRVVARARAAAPEVEARDVAALQALKDILRGLVWAEEALDDRQVVDAGRFFDELAGVVEATRYQLPVHPDREEILVADVVQARGIAFRAVAVLGLAEGEFPATLGEDPFLRDADRRRMNDAGGLSLEPSAESAEFEFFYETVTRPRERLLLTRPRLADDGAPWQSSPFWEEVRRLVAVEPRTLSSEGVIPPARVASWPELLESLAVHSGHGALRSWAAAERPQRWAAFERGAGIVALRSRGAATPFDGDLGEHAAEFGARFASRYPWSASRLETYRTCPFFFFVGRVLGLEPYEEPAEGLDARQLGNIYHRILERVYQAPGVTDATDVAQLLEALPTVAGAVLDAAPAREGFRETAWWAQTREEIVDNVRRSIEALAALPGAFAPLHHEAAFGVRGLPPLVVRDGDDGFQLRGFIDRVDRAPDGRLRIIDYKTAGPWGFTDRAVAEGKKLQLPLYALAARDALALGEPAEGFYWHVQHAEASAFTLGGFEGGPEGAMAAAVEKAWEAVRGARDGHFVPRPPDAGCPSYCVAAGFCWQYRQGYRG